MKERPILFSAKMVKAILEDRKSQTRRAMKPQPYKQDDWWIWEGTRPKAKRNSGHIAANHPPNEWISPTGVPYGYPGDRLWVRETWGIKPRIDPEQDWTTYLYRATSLDGYDIKWHPSIFMPREACRIQLEITDIRIEKLQDISEEDAIAEGISLPNYAEQSIKDIKYPEPSEIYASLWESINGKGSWDKNPWVWVITFQKIKS